MHCSSIPFPNLDNFQQQAVIDCYFTNEDYAKHPLDNKFKNYRNLHNWPNKITDLERICGTLDLGKYIPCMSIQRIIGPTFPVHTDVNRSCSAIYTVKGSATTVFYSDKYSPIQTIVMKLYNWYLFDNSTRHAVYDIEDDRISLCIDLTAYFANFTQALDFFSKDTDT